MSRYRRPGLILCCLLGGVAIATLVRVSPAQAAAWESDLRAFVESRDYVDALGRQIDIVEQQIAPNCIQIREDAQREQLRVRLRPRFHPELVWPVEGQWREQISIDRCGTRVLHNILVTAQRDGPPSLLSLLPGDTKASAEMQIAASEPAVTIAGAKAGITCRTGTRDIVDTRFVTYLDGTETLAANKRRWRENWTVRLCDQRVDVTVTFEPDGKGNYTHTVDLAN